ncbi:MULTISPECIES: glycosyltransferase family 2 protein [Sphingobacterium]|uniref:glycosyltransferase family 2 protein n=1 Tax=Sphingobacterium TaxID=28453 RepID=UPI00129CA7F3|nr:MULTISPECIES: glycosyltransferase family 2 protein [Sphingobacterium]MCS4166212.1 glycosyltransferase involved in cell wall biosynthesis [Sphingobacterium sp. BIGb0116]
MSKLVSVIIPCYNAEKYVEEAVRSIMKQTYLDLEIIVIDDCSTDRTNEILQSLSLEDSRIVFLKNETNLKLIKTLNLGISISKGKFIARMDADDISEPARLGEQVDFLTKNLDYGVVGTFGNIIKENRIIGKFVKPITDWEIKRELYFDSPFIHPSVMVRREIMENYDANFYQVEDYVLWVKLSKKTKFYNIPKALINYRILDTSETKKSQADHLFRHSTLKSVYNYLFDLNGIKLDDAELDQYTYSMFRPNFCKVKPLLLKKVYKKINRAQNDWKFMMRISERWFGTFILASHTSNELFVYFLSKYTYIGFFSLIYSRLRYVFN